MRTLLLPLALFGCADRPAPEALMQEIERALILPQGAAPLARYGRNYAYANDGHVLGVYVFPPTPTLTAANCAVLLDFGSRRCTATEYEAARERERRTIAEQAKAGERRWLDDRKLLPVVAEGGCAVIEIEYDVAAKRFIRLACKPKPQTA